MNSLPAGETHCQGANYESPEIFANLMILDIKPASNTQ
ncbi:hypothetical protein YPPY66_1558 [Yersinia pestis PY-66]|uniref:Uncharacterized protein n=1 Tax=Yersinia pestis PY-08 TaxID=992134 RepID=A0AB72ZMG1_YERPE|nr:hypothetical protein YPPY02_1343 [Yersinia pestis PY-02]EIR10022.1 hypothetical protein YPPY06_1389 [Yersinia pestis PY-06]EIR21623.1 hypothetical protein YPPY08_1397 [Yersinia pestis PY-08]EIR23445.1 hypothetical protein YPPY09_1410 [Yersinia pestis PY-09]EIR35618.1 hypothetical protein YPPY10_1438 [Yersinia pestis PY-10]EIR36552.1 hypothetical protein YPPY11_1480 [Yersinia pestis PY-11]EIR49271.1 hypothetical protein YPPY13_1413 [Yersinia pestis PY-13]EIR50228.1 hypothetical protein YPP